jgi:RNA polymerase sigma-70 factor, ECF subfamily
MATDEHPGSCDTVQVASKPEFGPRRRQAADGRAVESPDHPGTAGARSPSASRQDLVDAIKLTGRGDPVAFRRLYAATSVKLFGIVLRILGRRDLAEDVLQEAYIRVWQRATDFDPAVGSPTAWLVGIARSRALDVARRRAMRSRADCPALLQLPSDDHPHADHERGEERRRVQAWLQALEPEKNEIVQLAYHYGMTREEIAGRINRPVGTVQTWLRRSLAQLKCSLDP